MMINFPSECLLQRLVLSKDGVDGLAVAAANPHLSILECKYRKADGFADDELEIYNRMLEPMILGVSLVAPPEFSSLAILGGRSRFARLVAVDKAVIVIRLELTDGGLKTSYLIYDAVSLSLRLIPVPEQDPSWAYTLSRDASIARKTCQRQGDDVYALVHTGWLPFSRHGDLHVWRPSLPKPEHKKHEYPFLTGIKRADTHFSFNGQAYWVDLLLGVSYCSCDAFFVDNINKVEFGYTPLPIGIELGSPRHCKRVAEPAAYRTMGVVNDSFIRFVSIDGFQKYVKLRNRTVTVWKLVEERWEKEHELSLETLWGFKGFGDLPRDLTPMYPYLSTKDADLVYLVLGKYLQNRDNWKFMPTNTSYMLAVNMREKIITSALLLGDSMAPRRLFSCGFSPVGHCDEGGIPMKKPKTNKRRRGRH